ncbi:MAG: orotate phosphoribosyltransferase [Thermoanaerobaculia bacterium]|nr:orotate phosphoribosyltransferase [Thermoanaerobaculia bacterium]
MTAFDLQSLLRDTRALLSGHFRLSSGLHSNAYVQCARLLENPTDATAVGEALAAKLRPHGVDRIVAPALGGVVIGYTVAQALGVPMIFTERKDGVMSLRRGFDLESRTRVAIVEDVVTTGKSTRETQAVVESLGGTVLAFASIMNRSGGENPFDRSFEFLMRMALETWDEASCPLCARGIALDAPGSRFQR